MSKRERQYDIRPHRGKLVIQYEDEFGKRVRRSLGTDDRATAENRARQFWLKLHAPRSSKVSELWKPYKADRLQVVAEPERLGFAWKALEPFWGNKAGENISRDDCRSYIEQRRKQGCSNSTIKTELEYLRACLNFTLGDRAPKLYLPPPSKPRTDYLTKAQAEKFLQHIETPHVKLFVELAIGTGSRASALLDLTWDRVDFDRGLIDLQPAGRDITNKRRVEVPMSARLRHALLEAREAALTDYVIEYSGGPIKSVKKAIAAASRRSGIKASPHVFRHTAGVWMAEADVPMQKISQFLGHTSLRVTEQIYARYSPNFMRDAASALEW